MPIDREKVAAILEKKLQKNKELWGNLSSFEKELEVSEAFLAGYSSSKGEPKLLA